MDKGVKEMNIPFDKTSEDKPRDGEDIVFIVRATATSGLSIRSGLYAKGEIIEIFLDPATLESSGCLTTKWEDVVCWRPFCIRRGESKAADSQGD